ncbi:MAG: glycosyltransferase family 2 protein [Candidatus Woesearchaeota archaeon]
MENKYTKVLIGIPTYDGKDYCLDEFLDSLNKIDYPNKEILFIDNSDDPLHAEIIRKKGFNVVHITANDYYDKILKSRNAIRTYFLSKDFDYLFFIDSDTFVPADALQKLVKHDKDIISGVVFTLWTFGGEPKVRPSLFSYVSDEKMKVMTSESTKPGLYEIFSCGTACMLIKRAVLVKLSFTMPEDQKTSEDYWFCQKARQHGFKLWADTSVQCKHSIISNNKNLVIYLKDWKMHIDEKEIK